MNPLEKNIKYLPVIYQSLEMKTIYDAKGKKAVIKIKSINACIRSTQHFHRPISKIINFNE